LLLMQQQIDQLRVQLAQVLDQGTQLIQQQLSQILGHVNERLKENSEVLHRAQESLGERLDNAARGPRAKKSGQPGRGQPQDL